MVAGFEYHVSPKPRLATTEEKQDNWVGNNWGENWVKNNTLHI